MQENQDAGRYIYDITILDIGEIIESVSQIREGFADKANKKDAWESLVCLSGHEDYYVEKITGRAMGYVFPHVADNKEAWDRLINLMYNSSLPIRRGAAYALGAIFPHYPDKEKAWNDIYEFFNGDIQLQRGASYIIAIAFPHMPHKEQAWSILREFIYSDDNILKMGSTTSFRHLHYIPDNKQAWEDFQYVLKNDYTRHWAAYMVGPAFQYIPEKEKAWNILIKLANGGNWSNSDGASHNATISLGFAYPFMVDRNKAYSDIDSIKPNSTSKYYALGKAKIFEATQAKSDEEFKEHFERALSHLEKSIESGDESHLFFDVNPAYFCYPFFKSFYTITFEGQEVEPEVKKYLNEAKNSFKGLLNAQEGFEKKEFLLKAVEKLAGAIKEAYKEGEIDLESNKNKLNAFRQYCDGVEDLISAAEESAPIAADILHRGIPIIDRKIKKIIEEIQEKARKVREESRGTPAEEIANAIAHQVEEFHVGDSKQIAWVVENLYSMFKARVPSENKLIQDKIEDLKIEKDLAKLLNNVNFLNGEVPRIINQYAGRDINNINGDMNINNVAGNLNITKNSLPEDVLKLIQAIQQKVDELEVGDRDKKKINNHLDNAKIDLEEKEPDKKSIEESIKSANGILKEAKATGETLKEIGVMVGKAAVWLGTNAAALGWIF